MCRFKTKPIKQKYFFIPNNVKFLWELANIIVFHDSPYNTYTNYYIWKILIWFEFRFRFGSIAIHVFAVGNIEDVCCVFVVLRESCMKIGVSTFGFKTDYKAFCSQTCEFLNFFRITAVCKVKMVYRMIAISCNTDQYGLIHGPDGRIRSYKRRNRLQNYSHQS